MSTISTSDGLSEPPIKLSLRRRFLNVPNLVALLVAFSLIYFLVTKFDLDFKATWNTIQSNDLLLYVLAFVSYYLTFPLRALRWRIMLQNSGCLNTPEARNVSIRQLSEIAFLGWFVNAITIFRMGYLYRCHLLSLQLRDSLARIAGGLFAERILDTVVIFGLLALSAIGVMKLPASSFVGTVLIGALAASFLMVGLAVAMAFTGFNLKKFLPEQLKKGYGNFHQGTLYSFKSDWSWLAVLSILIWLAEAARLMLVVYALGLSVPLPLVIFVTLSVPLITTFPLTPGGLGVVEAGMVGLLAITLTQEQAVSVVLLDRSINFLSVILLGGVLFTYRSLRGTGLTPARLPVMPVRSASHRKLPT